MAGSFDSVRSEMVIIMEEADKRARGLPLYGIRRPKREVQPEPEPEKNEEVEPTPEPVDDLFSTPLDQLFPETVITMNTDLSMVPEEEKKPEPEPEPEPVPEPVLEPEPEPQPKPEEEVQQETSKLIFFIYHV